MSGQETWTVQILHKDAHCYYNYSGIVSLHEEGSYTVLVRNDRAVFKFPTVHIWRLKSTPEPK